MSLRGRMERLERHTSAHGLPCPGCGWTGPILLFNEYIDAAGRTVRWEDGNGNPLPDPPEIASCDLCKKQIKFIAIRRPVAADGAMQIQVIEVVRPPAPP
jgi:hypothetical protein